MPQTDEKKSRTRNSGFKTAEQIRKFLANVTNRLNKGEINREDARALAYLCNNILNLLKFQREGKLEEAVEELQELLKEHKDI